ncbi:MAG: tetratricopeptide repeat protein, partial [Thermoanaerobaculia bacterium]
DRSTEPPTAPGEPPPPPPAAPAAGGDEAPRPTVTLGRLYLRQGHATEAEGIFRAVLERDPDNREARRHLEELAREPAPALGAAELLEGYPAGERDGLTERKRHVLERYLDRLRGRSAHDVR